MTCIYAIKDWEKHFENSESRKIKSLTWLPVKNKHDGKGYRRVAAHPKSIQVFCAWHLIIQVASRMPVRGVLRDDDGPLTASDLSYKTGYPEHIFEEAFKVLVDPKIGWLECKNTASIPEAPETSRHVGTEQKGTEGNRRERNGTDYSLCTKLSGGLLRGIAVRILNNEDGWHYDNCKVPRNGFTLAQVETCLRPAIGLVSCGEALTGWREAVLKAHKDAVDGMLKTNAAASCIDEFKRRLGSNDGTQRGRDDAAPPATETQSRPSLK